MNLHFLGTKILLIILISQVLTSCLLLPGRLLPKVSNFPKKSATIPKPKVYIIAHYHSFNKFINTEPVESIGIKQAFTKILEKIGKRSHVFESYSFNRADSLGADFILQINLLDYDTEKDSASFRRKKLISGLSLWLIPVTYVENYKLTARLLDSQGHEVRTYLYEENIKAIIDLLFFPIGIVTSGVLRNVPENMVKNLYRDILIGPNLKISK